MDIQEQLNALALDHSNTVSYNDQDIVGNLRNITVEPIYIIIYSKMVTVESGTDFKHETSIEVGRSYNLEAQLLIKFPYLTKFPNWKGLFKEQCPTIFLIKDKHLKWLKQKNKSYLIKQKMH